MALSKQSRFSRVAEKATFPYFKHDNSVAIQDFVLKRFGHIVMALLLGMNEKNRILLQFGTDTTILDAQH